MGTEIYTIYRSSQPEIFVFLGRKLLVYVVFDSASNLKQFWGGGGPSIQLC